MSKIVQPLFTCLMVCFCFSATYAQTLNKPEPADNPNLAGNSPWTSVCASADFNEYFINFTWSPPLVNSDNKFVLELSDSSGKFTSPVALATESTKNTNFDFNFQFALPSDIRGDNYKFRVRSTSPAKTSPESDAYSMYYIAYNQGLLISPNGDGNIPSGGTIQLCDGNTVTLAPHNISNADTYQYNWYRSGTLLSNTTASINVSQAGMYNVEVDYGSNCSGSGNTLSNTIEITTGSSLGIAINPPAKTALCTGETVSLNANITGQGLTYTWYKNGTPITTPTVDDDTYTVDASAPGFEGDYTVEIYGSGTCLEQSAAVSITNAGDFTVSRDNAANIVVLPSQTETLAVSTTASSPIYQWFKDGTPISGANANTLNITEAGVYYAQVSQSGGACASTAINSESTTAVAPASFEIVIDYTSAYTGCESTSTTLGVKTINAIASDASKTDVTTGLLNNFTYQWKKDGINVSGATSNSISLADITENGNYLLEASLDSYNPTSNELPVQLLVNQTLEIVSSSLTYCSSDDAPVLSTATDLSAESFQWLKDGTAINTTDNQLKVTGTGTYQLVLDKNGCSLKSNQLTISPLDASLITLNPSENIVFPEGSSKTVTASGGTSYRWFDANNVEVSSTASINLTKEGTYLLIANIDACEISKQITASYQQNFTVPNVITVNGDGLNDQWVLPNTYSNNPEITVIIYNGNGEEVLNQNNYQNNWPQSTTAFTKQNMVFYYKIKNAKEVMKQGTITVIR